MSITTGTGDYALLDDDRQQQMRREVLGGLQGWVILASFTFMMTLTYFDRGAFASSLETFETSLGIERDAEGLLGSLFMIGYVAASPVFASMAKSYSPLQVMGYGLLFWVLANVATGFADGFVWMSIARPLTGVGEASFLCIGPSFINYVAPKSSKTIWLSVFYTSVPLGYALGYIITGAMISGEYLGDYWSWRGVFIGEGMLMLPMALFMLTVNGPSSIKDLEEESSVHEELSWSQLLSDLLEIARNPVFLFGALGYAAQTFFVGGIAFFGPSYAVEVLDLSIGSSTFSFGMVTFFAGVFGNLVGGGAVDFLRNKFDSSISSSLVYAFAVMFASSVVLIPTAFAIFQVTSYSLFFTLVFVGEFLAFLALSPVNSSILWALPVSLQPLGMSVSVALIHCLGDAISPFFIGKLLKHTHDNWRLCMEIMSSCLIVSSLLWGLGFNSSLKGRRHTTVASGYDEERLHLNNLSE